MLIVVVFCSAAASSVAAAGLFDIGRRHGSKHVGQRALIRSDARVAYRWKHGSPNSGSQNANGRHRAFGMEVGSRRTLRTESGVEAFIDADPVEEKSDDDEAEDDDDDDDGDAPDTDIEAPATEAKPNVKPATKLAESAMSAKNAEAEEDDDDNDGDAPHEDIETPAVEAKSAVKPATKSAEAANSTKHPSPDEDIETPAVEAKSVVKPATKSAEAEAEDDEDDVDAPDEDTKAPATEATTTAKPATKAAEAAESTNNPEVGDEEDDDDAPDQDIETPVTETETTVKPAAKPARKAAESAKPAKKKEEVAAAPAEAPKGGKSKVPIIVAVLLVICGGIGVRMMMQERTMNDTVDAAEAEERLQGPPTLNLDDQGEHEGDNVGAHGAGGEGEGGEEATQLEFTFQLCNVNYQKLTEVTLGGEQEHHGKEDEFYLEVEHAVKVGIASAIQDDGYPEADASKIVLEVNPENVAVKIDLSTNVLKEIGDKLMAEHGLGFKILQAAITCLNKVKEIDQVKVDKACPVGMTAISQPSAGGMKFTDRSAAGKRNSTDGGKGKGNKSRKVKGSQDDKVGTQAEHALRMVLLISRICRNLRRKACGAGTLKRVPQSGQKLVLICEAVGGTDMPSVNTFGGCDPLLEFRAVAGSNPLNKKGGNVSSSAKNSVKTQVRNNEMDPRWEEILELKGLAYKDDHYVQVILWDSGITGDTALGYWACTIKDAIYGLDIDPLRVDLPKNATAIEGMKSCISKKDLKSVINVNFSFVEMQSFAIKIIKGEKLPQVDTMGTIDSFVEARLVRSDPRKMENPVQPESKEIFWSGKTSIQTNTTEPQWKKEFSAVEVPGYASGFLQLVVWDDKSPLPDYAVAQCVFSFQDIYKAEPALSLGGKPNTKKLKLKELQGNPLPSGAKKASITIEIAWDICFDR